MLLQECEKTGPEAFRVLQEDFNRRVAALKDHAGEAGQKLSNLFQFCEDMFGMDSTGNSHEMVVLVTELTVSSSASRFISRYGSKEYFAHNDELLFYERQKDLIAELDGMEL